MIANETSVAADNSSQLFRESCAFLPQTRGFKLASLNITSLPKHIDELRVLLADNPLDVLSRNKA